MAEKTRQPASKLKLAAVQGAVIIHDGVGAVVITPKMARELINHLENLATLAENIKSPLEGDPSTLVEGFSPKTYHIN